MNKMSIAVFYDYNLSQPYFGFPSLVPLPKNGGPHMREIKLKQTGVLQLKQIVRNRSYCFSFIAVVVSGRRFNGASIPRY